MDILLSFMTSLTHLRGSKSSQLCVPDGAPPKGTFDLTVGCMTPEDHPGGGRTVGCKGGAGEGGAAGLTG